MHRPAEVERPVGETDAASDQVRAASQSGTQQDAEHGRRGPNQAHGQFLPCSYVIQRGGE